MAEDSELRPARPTLSTMARDAGRILALTWTVSPSFIIVELGSAVLTGLLPLLQAYLAGQLINALVAAVAGNGDIREAYLFLLLGGATLILSQASTAFTAYFSQLQNDLFDRELERRLNEQVLRLDQSYYEDGAFTSLLVKVRENLYALRRFVSQFSGLVRALIEMVGSMVILAAFNPWLLLVVGAVVIPLTRVELKVNLARSAFWDGVTDRWRFIGYLRWNLFGSVATLKELKLFQTERYFLDRFSEATKSVDDEMLAIGRSAELGRFGVQVLSTMADLGIQIWLIGRVLASQGAFGIGDFQFYRGIIQGFGTSVASVVYNMQQLQDSFLYIHDFFRLMALEPRLALPDPGSRLRREVVPKLAFQNVSFRYPGGRRPVLSDISFVLEPGERLAIVGVNGAGKTTLLKLLLRLYDPTKGTIHVNDTPLPEIQLASWYDQLGFLFQDFTRYSSLSVRENVVLGNLAARRDERRLKRALDAADASEFVAELPGGLDQILDPSYRAGTELSGGQWQRLALARSFFREPNVLILDEPTSAIDAAAEHKIFDHIFKTHQDKSMIIVSHRFSTVRRANHILVLEKGRAVEYGTHRELMRHAGRYKELFELQAEGYKNE